MPDFSPSARRRVAEETQKSIARKRPLGYPIRDPRIATPNKVIKLTQALQPFDSSTNKPGGGKGTLQLFDGEAFKDLGQEEVKVFNMTEATLKVGSYCLCNVCDGFFFYNITLCSNGS